MIKLKTAGDTIVEVIIASAVAGLVMVGAIVSINRSTKANQQARERTIALKIAETQLELMRVLAANINSPIFNPVGSPNNNVFCLNSTVNGYFVADAASIGGVPVPFSSPPIVKFPALNSAQDASMNYLDLCTVTNGVQYKVAIDMPNGQNPPGTGDFFLFKVYVRWDSITGNGHDEVNLSYDLNKSI